MRIVSVVNQSMFQLLRVFRAYRFVSQLNFQLESKTLKACRTHFEIACKTVSAQRILVEVEKMCL